MRVSKHLIIFILTATSLIFSQCEIYREGCMDPNAINYDVGADLDDGSCDFRLEPNTANCLSDIEGNLSITNETNETLQLYQNLIYITCIPANTENFIVHIPNQNSNIFKLQVWKDSEIENINEPDLLTVYRQWSVALSNTTLVDERANWLISNSETNNNSGTLLLSYPSLDEYNQQVIYQVDIFLNSKNGARIATLQAGASNKKVSIDYGIHYIYFRYWYSDPNTSSAKITEIGWAEKRDIVVNAEHASSNLKIPVYKSSLGKYGTIKIYNSTSNAISIYANDRLIESIAEVDGSSEGLSIIPAQSSTTFLIPVDEYLITAKSIDGTTNITSFANVDVIQADVTIKNVGINHDLTNITNNTSETLLLYSEGGNYLGKTIMAGTNSGLYNIPSGYDNIILTTSDKSKKKTITVAAEITINNLDDFSVQNLTITNSWTLISNNYYKSPDINDNESTFMQATLTNSNSVTLYFEYKVNSELDYDKFSFSLDGNKIISNKSGTATGWINFSMNITSGDHTLKWLYQKDQIHSLGTDNVEIRNISVN